MAQRYYYCGQTGGGTTLDPFRPEIVDEIGATSWAANQESSEQPQFVVWIDDPEGVLHTELAYAAVSNPNGYDWIEVAEDGSVILHAA